MNRGYIFEINGGEDCLSIRVGRRQAINLIAQLANGLKFPDQEELELSWCGLLKLVEQGDLSIPDALTEPTSATGSL